MAKYFIPILLLAYSANEGVTLPTPSDTIIFPKSDDDSPKVDVRQTSLTPSPAKSDIIRCLDLGDWMPAFNQTTFKFDCYPLASRGPCPGKDLLRRTILLSNLAVWCDLDKNDFTQIIQCFN
jgi:hypothetical protein